MPSPLPPFELQRWRALPFAERMRQICQAWALEGYDPPVALYLAYLVKVGLIYVGGWCFFCGFTPGLGSPTELMEWAATPVAFQKALLWSMAYEGLGLGCASGPLTGRTAPPIGGLLYFLRPGTTKLPLWPGMPLLGGHRRTWLDVALYLAHQAVIFRALMSPEISPDLLWPTLLLLPLLGLADKTLFLASRSEHYYTALLCLVFAGPWIAGCQLVWVAIWLWAATSKFNHHFTSAVCVMLSNSPVVPVWLRRRLYRDYPDDLRPSTLAACMAHAGTFTEYAFPLLLLCGDGGTLTLVGLTVMALFHLFITSHMPMGVPLEWNVMMVYGGLFLFGEHASVSILEMGAEPLLLAALAVPLLLVPVLGNLFPARVSFLLSMRYYAGNWATSVWLFRGDSLRKLNTLVKAAPLVRDQLRGLNYSEERIDELLCSMPAFRLLHLHGRAFHDLLPRAIDDIDDYEWVDGEVVAGLALGWNFGDGHLHDERLLRVIQQQCGFEEGELRCIFIESQPLGSSGLGWRIADAKRGLLARGTTDVAVLRARQPWPAVDQGTCNQAKG